MVPVRANPAPVTTFPFPTFLSLKVPLMLEQLIETSSDPIVPVNNSEPQATAAVVDPLKTLFEAENPEVILKTALVISKVLETLIAAA